MNWLTEEDRRAMIEYEARLLREAYAEILAGPVSAPERPQLRLVKSDNDLSIDGGNERDRS